MNESVSSPFIRYPIATSLLMAGILFIGLVSYPLLPVAPLPQVDFPTIQVSANLPGASPETMASSVAQPLERQFAQIPGVAQMTSTSSLGSAAVTIQFDLNRSIDGAANDVQAAINAAGGQLPKNLPNPPTYRKVNPADSPILLLSATSDTLPLTEVSNETIVVALAAGVAGMLALETRASAGVGVAVSVTTIPAAAYLGVAAGLGEADQARGAVGVLGANVAMLVVGASGTLTLQRLVARRAVPGRALRR